MIKILSVTMVPLAVIAPQIDNVYTFLVTYLTPEGNVQYCQLGDVTARMFEQFVINELL